MERLEGEVYRMSPMGPRQGSAVALLTKRFTEALGERALVWPQNPIRIPPHFELQPDLALLLPRDYRDALPTPEDVLRVVEVAGSGLEHDPNRKLPLYAQVWILDLKAEGLPVFRAPRAGEEAEPHSFPGVRIPWP